jgi:acetolactate synthase-1/2/3 large subunit
MTGADALVQGLIRTGVEHVFGLPGDTGVDFYDSLYRAAPLIRHVMCRDERHATSMADVYARCRNTLGVVEVSSGGGATYCVGGLGEPFAASVPLLVISSDIHVGSRNTGALTELDQEKLFSSVTKWVRRADRAADIPGLLAEAIEAATSGRPAPVALIIPEDVLAEGTDAAPIAVDVRVPARRTAADPEAIAAVASALTEAERPAVVAGGGVHLSGAYEELARLGEAAAVPIATTIHGKGAYPESDAWSLGVIGGNGGRPYANDYLATADFVLFVGTRANATDTNSYKCPPRSTRVAQIDIDLERAGRNYPDGIRVVADAKCALSDLGGRVSVGDDRRACRRRELEDLREGWRTVEVPATSDGTVHPLAVFRLLRDAFGADAIVVADCGTATPLINAHWESTTPGRRIIMARGHGPMGYAIPGSLGAALANPGKRVIAVTTDGSLAMACGELETVARLQLPITFVQLTNGSLGWIKMLQHLYYERRYFGVDLGPVDAPAVAEAFGVPATRVESTDELRRALEACRGVPGPMFLEVMVPDTIALELPVASWTAAIDGADVVRPVY